MLQKNTKYNEYGTDPLTWAAYNGHEAVVCLLLEKGAHIESADVNGLAGCTTTKITPSERILRFLKH